MASQQESESRYFPPLKKETRRKNDWEELSYQLGRKMVGGESSTQNPNISNIGIEEWLNLMASQRQKRKKGVEFLWKGVTSVAQERIDHEANPGEINGPVMPLNIVADYLYDTIKPKIGKRGKSGNSSMTTLKDLATQLYYCDKTPVKIGKIILPFRWNSLKP